MNFFVLYSEVSSVCEERRGNPETGRRPDSNVTFSSLVVCFPSCVCVA